MSVSLRVRTCVRVCVTMYECTAAIFQYLFVFVLVQAHFDVDGKRHFPFGRGHMDELVRARTCV